MTKAVKIYLAKDTMLLEANGKVYVPSGNDFLELEGKVTQIPQDAFVLEVNANVHEIIGQLKQSLPELDASNLLPFLGLSELGEQGE